MSIDYLQSPLGYLVRIPVGDHAAGSPLDEPARDRAEQAAAFLRLERIGRIFASDSQAARDTAEIAWLSCSWDFTDQACCGKAGVSAFLMFLRNLDRGLPCVLVATRGEIESALMALGISLDNHPGDAPGQPQQANNGLAGDPGGANVCKEIVGPGGVISLHQDPAEGGCATRVIARARTMVLDFSFTDFVKAAAWSNADLAIEKPCSS